jgi:hypothetical protein
MEDGIMNSIGQKPRGFWQTDDCEFHLCSLAFLMTHLLQVAGGQGQSE